MSNPFYGLPISVLVEIRRAMMAKEVTLQVPDFLTTPEVQAWLRGCEEKILMAVNHDLAVRAFDVWQRLHAESA